jgi:hypothetical protein
VIRFGSGPFESRAKQPHNADEDAALHAANERVLEEGANLQRSLALHFMHYNFCRKHSTIRTTPAIAAGLTDRMWTLHDLAQLPDLMAGGSAA